MGPLRGAPPQAQAVAQTLDRGSALAGADQPLVALLNLPMTLTLNQAATMTQTHAMLRSALDSTAAICPCAKMCVKCLSPTSS